MSTALVVSGGGSKGAFAVGAIDYLRRTRGLEFDIVSGTSTGSLIAPFVVSDDIQALVDTYGNINFEDIYSPRRPRDILGSPSLLSSEPLETLLANMITEERAERIFADDAPRLFVAATCLQDRSVTYFHTGEAPTVETGGAGPRYRRLTGRDDLLKACQGSANFPLVAPPVRFDEGTDLRQYVDGGVREVAPLRAPIAAGASTIYAIVLSPESESPTATDYENILPVAGRAIQLLLHDVVVNDVAQAELVNRAVDFLGSLREMLVRDHGLQPDDVEALLRQAGNPFEDDELCELHMIRPEEDLGDALEFNPEFMGQMMDLGRERAQELVPQAAVA
jgi:predicted acylesterase/phospholipase RssA